MEALSTTALLIAFAVFLFFVVVALYFYFNGKITLKDEVNKGLKEMLELVRKELDQERNLLLDEKNRAIELKSENTRLDTELKNVQLTLTKLAENEVLQEQKFENIANRILTKQSSTFTLDQKTKLEEVLSPLKTQITTFERKIEQSNLEATEKIATLKAHIHNLSEQTIQVSKDANALAMALKADYKKQGNWGEIILESILEKSGLDKGREYFTQNTYQNDDGKVQRPDVIIKLPDNKVLIIDSKVSLVAYDAIFRAEDEEEAKRFQKAHMVAIKNHIQGLAKKNYHDLYKTESPDFVLMFIPIDTAFSIALQEDPDIYRFAFDKNIVIVTSSTLLATLKTVDTMWKNDKYNRNALEIAEEAGKMHDKFVSFLQNMEKLGKQINTIGNTYETSMKQLSTGSGNLVGKAKKLKEMGAKTNKKLDVPVNRWEGEEE